MSCVEELNCFQITARETLTAEKRQESLVVHVTIQDENDNSPAFTINSYNISIPENTKHGTSISTVHVMQLSPILLRLHCSNCQTIKTETTTEIKVKRQFIE